MVGVARRAPSAGKGLVSRFQRGRAHTTSFRGSASESDREAAGCGVVSEPIDVVERAMEGEEGLIY